MICKKLDLEALPASCMVCLSLNETILRHGGRNTGHYLFCDLLPGESIGSTEEHFAALHTQRHEKCPLLEVGWMKVEEGRSTAGTRWFSVK